MTLPHPQYVDNPVAYYSAISQSQRVLRTIEIQRDRSRFTYRFSQPLYLSIFPDANARKIIDPRHPFFPRIQCVGGPDTRWFQAEYVGVRADLFSAFAELCSSAYHHSRLGRWPGPHNVPLTEQATHTPFWVSVLLLLTDSFHIHRTQRQVNG